MRRYLDSDLRGIKLWFVPCGTVGAVVRRTYLLLAETEEFQEVMVKQYRCYFHVNSLSK